MERRIAGIIYILIIFALVNEMSINVYARDHNKKQTKEKSRGFQENICDIKDRYSKVHCYCESTSEPRSATKADCWVFNGGITPDEHIWQAFASQTTLQTLSFNVRVDGALEYIPTKALIHLHRLKSITMKYGNIVKITSFAFANLTNLKEADLSQNLIETLQPYSFAHLPNLTTINLEDNMIIDIDTKAFIELPKLQKLVFTKNNISKIKNGTFQHTFNLLELDLNKNSIYCLNRRTFDGLANLKRLDLRKNRIQNLTEFTFAELWNLQELLLGKNNLRYISERAFDGLSQLKKLSLDANKLATLPSALFEGVRGLNSVDLRSNELHALTFDNMKPILENLKLQNSTLLLEENKFVCDCKLKWMYWLRNETESQNIKDSLDGVTCNMEPPIVSAPYNKVSGAFKDSKLDYNKDILHTLLTIETLNDKINITENKLLTLNLTTNDSNEINKMSVKRNVLETPLDTFPCPREVLATTKMPSFISDSVIQNEIKTYRFQEINSAAISLGSCLLFLWWICVRLFIT